VAANNAEISELHKSKLFFISPFFFPAKPFIFLPFKGVDPPVDHKF
jgi:hypothetical protein